MKKVDFRKNRKAKTNLTIQMGLVLAFTLFSCSKDDGPPPVEPDPVVIVEPEPEPVVEENLVFGKWEISTGRFLIDNSKYVHISEDNTVYVLSEDELGFKREFTTNITVSNTQIVSSGGYGSGIHNYTIEGDNLTIVLPAGAGEVLLFRNEGAPNPDTWLKTLTILDEGDAPWEGEVDIAFTGTHILYGKDRDLPQIGLVNPGTFNLDDTISTNKSAYAVEVEKYDGPFDRYIFQSDNGHSKFYAYQESDNALAFTSLDTGAWIMGLASVDDSHLWVSSSNTSSLYLYRYIGEDGEILETIELDFQPDGLEHHDGFLYLSDGNRMHKCQTTPEFRAVESYKLQNHSISGIAYDGTDFWFSTRTSGDYKLVKANL